MLNKLIKKIKETEDTTVLINLKDTIPLENLSFAEKKQLLHELNIKYYAVTYEADTHWASDEWRPATGDWLFQQNEIDPYILEKAGIPTSVIWEDDKKYFTLNSHKFLKSSKKLISEDDFNETWEVTSIKSVSKIYRQLISPLLSTIAKIRDDFFYTDSFRCFSLTTTNICFDYQTLITVEKETGFKNDVCFLYFFISDDSLFSENYQYSESQNRIIFSAAVIKNSKIVQLQSADLNLIKKFLIDNGYPVNIFPEENSIKIYIPSDRH